MNLCSWFETVSLKDHSKIAARMQIGCLSVANLVFLVFKEKLCSSACGLVNGWPSMLKLKSLDRFGCPIEDMWRHLFFEKFIKFSQSWCDSNT